MTFAPFQHGRLTRRTALRRAGVASAGIAVLPLLQACGPEQAPPAATAPPTATLPPAATQPPAATPPPAAATQRPVGAATLPAAAKPGESVVEMNDQLKFVPDKLTIKAGETVTWTNVGAVPHTSTADPTKVQDPDHVTLPEGAEPWDSGLINQGQSWSYTFEVAGDYAYVCIPHETVGMLATLIVTP